MHANFEDKAFIFLFDPVTIRQDSSDFAILPRIAVIPRRPEASWRVSLRIVREVIDWIVPLLQSGDFNAVKYLIESKPANTPSSGLRPPSPPFARGEGTWSQRLSIENLFMMTSFRILATTFVLISLASTACAQFGSTTGTGGTGSIGSMTGSSSTSQSATGGSATGPSGATGGGLQALSGNSNFAGTVPGQATTASNATDTFIGSNATTGFVGGASQAGNQQGTNRQFQALQNNLSQQGTSQQSGTVREIRSTLRVAFAFPSATQLQMNGSLANANIASLRRFSPIRPELEGIEVALSSSGIAVLTGSAPNVETRRLAANLIRLQPGIRKVENQIVVQAN